MARRYAYWRKPTGAANKSQDDKDKHAPKGLLADIGSTASIDSEGHISWKGMSFLRFEQAVLGSIILLDPEGLELNEHDARSIVRSAMRALVENSGGQSAIEPAALLRESDRQAAAFFQRRQNPYHLVTSLSITSLPAEELLVDKCRVLPLRAPARYPIPDILRHRLESDAGLSRRWLRGHQPVRVKADGRSQFDAVDRALEALSFLCGLWNLFVTPGWSIRSGSLKDRPLGVVNIGPFHTLHERNGTPVEDFYWYDADYAARREPFRPTGGWTKIERNRRWAMQRLRHVPFGQDLRRLIIRYAAALSKSDANVAFLQMWSILESITNTIGTKYEETVRRATWIFKDRDLAKELLAYLRCYRNQYVHSARSDENQDQIAWLVKSFIDPHLLILLRNDFGVQSLREYAEFLSLPTSVDELRRRRQQMARAFNIRVNWRATQG